MLSNHQHQIFSLPINPKLPEEFVENIFIPFLIKYREYIFDLYFTCRMPPFTQDAMGDLFGNPKDTTLSALYISKKTGIPLSATFNNIYIRPDQETLDLFIKNFKYVILETRNSKNLYTNNLYFLLTHNFLNLFISGNIATNFLTISILDIFE